MKEAQKIDPIAREESNRRMDQAITDAVAWREAVLKENPGFFTNLPAVSGTTIPYRLRKGSFADILKRLKSRLRNTLNIS